MTLEQLREKGYAITYYNGHYQLFKGNKLKEYKAKTLHEFLALLSKK